MDRDWQRWVDECNEKGCSPDEVLSVLLKNGFLVPTIRQAMGNTFPEDSPILYNAPAQYPVGRITAGVDHKTISQFVSQRLEKIPGIHRVPTKELQLFVLDDFLTQQECDGLVDRINTSLYPSSVVAYDPDKKIRTSYSSDLGHMKDPFVMAIDDKICWAIGIRPQYSDTMQAQKYQVGQEFKAHTDYFEPGTIGHEEHTAHIGNRTWTFMVYLNDTPKGGGTSFVRVDQTFYPKKGRAVIWNNLYIDGMPNPDTHHWGMPVEEGEKYIITKWFREKAGAMFYDVK